MPTRGPKHRCSRCFDCLFQLKLSRTSNSKFIPSYDVCYFYRGKWLYFLHTSPWRNTAIIYRVLVFFKVDKKLHAKRNWIPQIYCVLPSNPWKKLLEACMRAWKSQGRIIVESGWFELKNLMTLLKKMRLLRNKRRPVELLSSATAFIFWQTSAEGCRFWKP